MALRARMRRCDSRAALIMGLLQFGSPGSGELVRPYEDRVGRPLQPEARAPRQRQRAFARLRDVLNVRVCGALEVEADQRVLPDALFGGRQGRLVFAFLVCERHRAVRREELAELLWPEQLPESWSASLSAVVSRLRRLLAEAGLDGTAALASTAGSYQLLLPPDATVDIEALAAAVDGGRDRGRDAGDTERALSAAAAASRHRGARLPDRRLRVGRSAARSVRDLRVRAALAQSVAHLAAGASGSRRRRRARCRSRSTRRARRRTGS